MSEDGKEARRWWVVAALALGLALGRFLLVGDLNLNMRDEGYLWYGVEAVRAGDVPLRDFQAYDPARYYWCAWLAPLFGPGLIGIRGACALAQAIGIACGLQIARRLVRSDLALVPVGLLLCLWGFPRFKLFESTISLALLLALVRLLERPEGRRALQLGLVVGLVAFFGRNHGVYGAAASLVALGLLARRGSGAAPLGTLLPRWGLGVVLGYAPLLLMLVLVPGFAVGFWNAVTMILERGANLPKDYPWGWGAPIGEFGLVRGVAHQLAFYLPVLVLPVALVAAWRTPREELARRAVLVAALIVCAVYVHHYSIRSEVPHLAQGAQPLLICALSLGALLGGRAVLAVLGLLTLHALVFAFSFHPVLRDLDPTRERPALGTLALDGYDLRVPQAQARHLERILRLLGEAVPEESGMFIAPTQPTFYPLLGKLAPTWWIYYLWPLTEEEQARTIADLQADGVDWALVIEKSFADEDAFDFRQTNPLVWAHLTGEWMILNRVARNYVLFRKPPRRTGD